MSFKVSYRKSFFRLLVAVAVGVCFSPSVALAVDITSGNSPYTHSGTSTSAHVIDKNDEGNITMTNDGTITKTGNNAVKMDSVTNPTLTNNAGAVIETVISSGTNGNNAIKATSAVKPTIIATSWRKKFFLNKTLKLIVHHYSAFYLHFSIRQLIREHRTEKSRTS